MYICIHRIYLIKSIIKETFVLEDRKQILLERNVYVIFLYRIYSLLPLTFGRVEFHNLFSDRKRAILKKRLFQRIVYKLHATQSGRKKSSSSGSKNKVFSSKGNRFFAKKISGFYRRSENEECLIRRIFLPWIILESINLSFQY